MEESKSKRRKHIMLTTHPGSFGPQSLPIHWGASDPKVRGPIIGTMTTPRHRNCVGTHSGSYTVYHALSVASGALDPLHIPDLTDTHPAVDIGPHPSWFTKSEDGGDGIISMDPFGADIGKYFAEELKQGYNIRPTIAVTTAHVKIPELVEEVKQSRLKVDGEILLDGGSCRVVKAAIEPVWYLPGIAHRFGVDESHLRRCLFEHTGGMFPELVTRTDLSVFLPPTGGHTVYIFGDPSAIADPSKELAVRVHDECNGSDVFGSDICTCRPYLVHGIEVCIQHAQKGGVGVIVYNRKEGRALGEVTKFLVYNARKRQEGGDRASAYFHRTECVAGVEDMRFQELMPDVLRWLGMKKIDVFVSMSNMKSNAVKSAGIDIVQQLSIPDELIPEDARVEMDAKKAAGYFTEGHVPDEVELTTAKGRKL